MQQAESTLRDEIIAREQELLTAIFKGDKEKMREFMTPDGIGVDGEFGFALQADLIAGIHNLSSIAWRMEQTRVIFPDKTSCIITYLLHQSGTFSGMAIPEKVYATSLWSYVSGAWKALFHQESAYEEMG